MNGNETHLQRRAWLVLLAAFATCCVLTVGVPSTVLYIVNSASYAPNITVRLQAGIVTAFCDNEPEQDAKVVSVQGRPLTEGCTIMVGADNESIAELFVDRPSTASEPILPLMRMQLYAGTRLKIDQARLPRFRLSAALPSLIFGMSRGRIELQTPTATPVQIKVNTTELGMSIAEPGAYAVWIDGVQSQAFVWEGQAKISKTDSMMLAQTLRAGQRLRVDASSEGLTPISLPQNLVRNSDFSSTLLSPNWRVLLDTSDGKMTGTAAITSAIIMPMLDLSRVGENLGWGHTGVVQDISAVVSDTRDLRVRIAFQILEQQIEVCGSQGSECPLMIDMRYRRKDDSSGQWLQGFYARGQALGGVLPDYMIANRQGRHIFKPAGMPQLFVSENLIQIIPGIERVETLEVYAEGHSVHIQVLRVELLSDR